MKTSRIITVLICLLLPFGTFAQDPSLSPQTQAVYEACIRLTKAIGSGSKAGLQAANKAFKACQAKEFAQLEVLDEHPLSLNNHFIFDEVFIDSLIAGRHVYQFAQRYADSRAVRGFSSSGNIFVATHAVSGNSSASYSFRSKGRQELAVVAEPGGKITLRVHDKTHNTWYNDTEKVKEGESSRLLVFDLPENEVSVLEVEVINTTSRDISFAIISN